MALLNLKDHENLTLDHISKTEILDLVYVFEIDKDNQMTIIRPSSIIKNFKEYVFLVGDIRIN